LLQAEHAVADENEAQLESVEVTAEQEDVEVKKKLAEQTKQVVEVL